MTLGSQGTFTGASGHFWGKFRVFIGLEGCNQFFLENIPSLILKFSGGSFNDKKP